ncbi:MAG: hypothetical protein CMH57_13430 [Myxococcales bacterium]|nr:hypothetical protein [Myxococcales bacterium]
MLVQSCSLSRHTTRAAVVAVALCLSATAFAKPKPPRKLDTSETTAQTFRYKYKAAQARDFGLNMTQELSMEQGAAMPAVNTTSTVKAVMNVKTQQVLPNGMATIETSYKDFDLSVTNNGVEMGKAQLKNFESLLKGIRSTSKMNPRGVSQDFQYEGIDPSMKQMTDSMKSVTKGLTPVFPEKALKIGENWKDVDTITVSQGPIKLSLKFTITYTFLGHTQLKKRRVAVFKSDINMTVNDTSNSAGTTIKVKGRGAGVGYLYFDNKAGALIKSELEMDQTTHMTVEGANAPAGGAQSMKMSQKTATTMELKDTP